MRMDREIKELLVIVRDTIITHIPRLTNLNRYYVGSGLCRLLDQLRMDYIISRDENDILYNYLRENRPTTKSHKYYNADYTG